MELFLGEGVGEGELGGGEEVALDGEVLAGVFVGGVVAVAGVADDGVSDVGEVAAELVAAAGVGIELDEGVAGGGVAVGWIRELGGGEGFVEGEGVLGGVGLFLGVLVFELGEGGVDGAGGIGPAADDGLVGFLDLAGFEELHGGGEGFVVEGEEEESGDGTVEAVDGGDALADLVAEELDGDLGGVGVEGAAVDEQTVWLVDGDVSVVSIQDLEGRVDFVGGDVGGFGEVVGLVVGHGREEIVCRAN